MPANHLTLLKPVKSNPKSSRQETSEARLVKARLKEMGKNVAWLADQINVTPPTIYNEISGRHAMPKGRYRFMLNVLGIDENLLYGVGQYARVDTGRN